MPERNRPLTLGHRGARAVRSIPENTLESFDRALADGCDGFEFDVRLTADCVPVVCHDPRFHRIEIARAAAARLPQVPRLEDILSRYRQRAFLNIELKVGGLERITLDLLRKHPPERGFVVSSFLPEVLVGLRENGQQVPLGLICQTRAQLRRWNEIPVEYVIPHYRLATAALVHELKNARKKVMVWTVNDPKAMVRLKDFGVDGIISDDPARLCRVV